MNDAYQSSNTALVRAMAMGIIFGALAGGIVGYGVTVTKLQTSGNGSSTVTSSTMTVKEESQTIEVVKKANPAVVSIIASQDFSKIYQQQQSPFSFFGFSFPQTVPQGQQTVSQGSGFIVSSEGLIVTNRHVVDNAQASYSVVMNDGKKYDAQVVATDPVNDVAVVKIEAHNLPTLTLGNSDGVEIGQTVIAIGNAQGQYRNTVTKGIISGKARTITAGDNSTGQSETLEDVFQTDAAINSGNSGGPLLNLGGQVIAINTAIDQNGQLIGFAIPINVVQKDLQSVNATGKITQPYLGVRYVVITQALADQNKLPYNHGALIQPGSTDGELAVVAGSPADKAGLVENDIILQVDGKDITTDHTLIGALSAHKVGDTVTLKVYHKGQTKDVKVTLEERK